MDTLRNNGIRGDEHNVDFCKEQVWEELFDLAKFDSNKEDNRREVKRAESGLPNKCSKIEKSFPG